MPADVTEIDAPLIKKPEDEQPPANILIPRDDAATELAVALGAVRIIEKERRWSDAITRLGGWVVSGVIAVPLIMAVHALSNQKPPEDKIFLSMIHSDGSVTNPAKPIEDQSPSEREATATKFMYDYVDYRVSYDFAHLRYNYDWVRFTTVDDAQAAYIAAMTTDPTRPTETLGKDGERRVGDKSANRVGPDAFEVTYRVKTKLKQGGWQPEVTCRVRITYNRSDDMPAEVAARLDPLKLVVTRWSSHPDVYDPTTPGVTLCGS